MKRMDRESVMAWLEGLTQDDWRTFHSDSEVQEIARNALELLKEQEERIKQLEAISVIHNVSFTQIGKNNKQIINNGPMTMTFGK